ncbi:MAG TPA: Zn-dependent alcohol dehydrogenase [Gemmatales bacterium]|nr:Zn-dependent alcohol dehydrogenase [Tepidiformaceae bacterium]HMP04176.1 Zn-dependent alcohol dehydrogenase [Gemmatales bacterium]
MKAAVMYGANQPLVIEDVEIDEPGPGEVLVRTAASGVCHSDLHFMEGSYPSQVPIVLGHESAGVVERVGPNVANVTPGDRVVVAFVASCGSCENCVTGRPYLCMNSASLGRPGRISLRGGTLHQFANMSAFAEYQLVSAGACVKVPDGVPLECAALVGCSVMTGVGAVTNTAKIPAGSTVAVIGAGGVGLNVIQGAVLAGAARVIAIDLLESKLAAARQFGATDVVDGSKDDAVAQVVAMTNGGVDFAFEAIGLAKTAEQAFGMIKRGGRAVVVGMIPVTQMVSVPGAAFLGEKGIIGSFYGSTRQTYDMPWLMELYRQKRLKIDELISRRWNLSQINEAYAALKAGEVNRSVIAFD